MRAVNGAFRLWLLAVLVAACTVRPPPGGADTPIGMPLATLLQLIREGEPVLDRLPEPAQVRVEQERNPQQPTRVDTIRVLAYSGLALTVHESPDTPQPQVREVAVTDPIYRTADGLHVGSPLQDLSDALGEADRLEGDEYVYLSAGPPPTATRFRVEGERIVEIRWEFGTDGAGAGERIEEGRPGGPALRRSVTSV